MGEVDRERCGAREETRERDREMGIRSGLGLRRCVGTRGETGRARVRKGLGGLDLQANGPAWFVG